MDRRFLKPAVARTLLGVALVFPAVAIRNLCISSWPRQERLIEVTFALLLAIALYLLVFKPLLNYVDRSNKDSAGN